MQALLSLSGVGVPTASTLLYFAFPALYPILDVRALESLGVKPRSQYPISFWLGYLEACRALAAQCGVSIRTLDKALWQWSKERSAAAGLRGDRAMGSAGGGSRTPTGLRPPAPKAGVSTVSPRPRGVERIVRHADRECCAHVQRFQQVRSGFVAQVRNVRPGYARHPSQSGQGDLQADQASSSWRC